MRFEVETNGIRVGVTVEFLEHDSEPDEHRFVWAYKVRINNRTESKVQLLTRYWRLTDCEGLTQEVRGDGVVGRQPTISPGETYEYASAAPLSAPSGVMSGSYGMVRVDDGERFEALTPAFPLESPYARRLAN